MDATHAGDGSGMPWLHSACCEQIETFIRLGQCIGGRRKKKDPNVGWNCNESNKLHRRLGLPLYPQIDKAVVVSMCSRKIVI